MPEIVIQARTFERLQRFAKPFEDTPDSVIGRALDALEWMTKAGNGNKGQSAEPERLIDIRNVPKLTHTKVLEASIEGTPVPKANWNGLLDEMIRRAIKRSGNFDRLRRIFPVNMVQGRKEDEGYGYLPDIDVSVQGQDANGACRAIIMAAQSLGTSMDIIFIWRPKEGATYPGERGRIRLAGTGIQEVTHERVA